MADKKEYGDGFLYADDFVRDGKWCQFALTIKGIVPPNTIKAANKQMVDKVCLQFEEASKILAVNTTNERLLKMACGSAKSDNWVGKKVTFYPVSVDAFGQTNVPALRVRLPKEVPMPFSARKQLGRDLTGKSLQVQTAGSDAAT